MTGRKALDLSPSGAPPFSLARRRFPGSAISASLITLAVEGLPTAPPAVPPRAVELLRRARALGVTTFDVVDASHPEHAERIISQAFPHPDSGVGVIVGRSASGLADRAGGGRENRGGRDASSLLEASLEESRRRLGKAALIGMEWTEDTEMASSSENIPTSGPVWPNDPRIVRIRRLRQATTLPQPSDEPHVVSGELSLLESQWEGLSRVAQPAEFGLVARDPFSGGRLDGTMFSDVSIARRPGSAPVDLRRLHRDFDPILRFEFLTAGRRRTLAQAALHFVLRSPSVVTAVVPLPEPERFDEILGFGLTPELSEAELARLDRLK